MKHILWPLVLFLLLAGTHNILAKIPSKHKTTATFKTQDGSTFRCDVHRSDVKTILKLKKGDMVQMVCDWGEGWGNGGCTAGIGALQPHSHWAKTQPTSSQ